MFSRLVNSAHIRLENFWNKLVEPDASLQDPEKRQQANLLLAVLWVILLVTCVIFIARALAHGLHVDVDLFLRVGIALFVFGAVSFGRQGHIRAIGLGADLFGVLIIFALALFGGDRVDVTPLNYLVVILLFSSIFVPLRFNIAIFAFQLISILAFSWLPGVTFSDIVAGPFSLNLTLGAIVLVVTQYLQILEAARKAQISSSEKRFREIFEASPIGMKLYDAQGQLQRVNPACLAILGIHPAAALEGPNLFSDPALSADIKERIRRGETARFENRGSAQNGESHPDIRYQDVIVTPLPEEHQMRGYLMQLVDISEQKRVEDILRESRTNLLLVSDSVPAMIAYINAEQRYIFVNQPYADFFKQAPKEAIGRLLRDVVGEQVYADFSPYIERVFEGVRVEFESTLRNAQGSERIIQTSLVPSINGSGLVRAYFAMLQDITERKQAEASLARKARQLELLNHTGERLAAITSVSDVLNRAVQLLRQSFNYHHVAIFLYDDNFDDWVMMAKAGDFFDLFPAEHRIKQGVGIIGWVASHAQMRLANDVNADPLYVNFYPDILPTQSELCVPILIGDQTTGILDVQSPQREAFDDSDILVMQTMADQIAVSLENARLHILAQQELAQRGRTETSLQVALQEKEVLLKEVHHRVKNNLQVISSMLNLRADMVDDPKAIQAFQSCQNSISAIALVHKSLYESPSLANITADEYLGNLINRLQATFGEKADWVRLTVELAPINLDFDTAIPCGLILNELVTNAYKYAFPVGHPQEQACEVHISLIEKDRRCALTVRDNGVGLPPDFESKKDQALGLQLVSLLTKQIKGRLTVEGKSGTRIEIIFPSPG